MPARKAGRPAPAGPRADRAQRAERPVPEHLVEFQRGLFTLLLQEDVEAFQRYLARWEEVIGDTAALGELPRDEIKVLMGRLLRRPQQYNLPPWPAELQDEAEAGQWPIPGRMLHPVTPVAPEPPDLEMVWPESPPPPAGLAAPGGAHSIEADSEPLAAHLAEGARVEEVREPGPAAPYQVDMLTGEMVPVMDRRPGDVTIAETTMPVRRRPRRRRLPDNLVQLELWSA